MAICPPNTAITRILAALGLENVRSLKINAAVNDVVTVVTEQYVTGTQMDDLAVALETKEWMLVPKATGRWVSVDERLPPLLTEVLGWHPADRARAWFRHSGTVQGGLRQGTYWESWSPQDRECDDCEVDAPTHWMPLPEPPEEE
jgi:hypothetical protein